MKRRKSTDRDASVATRAERPILFSAPMVRALLDGSKTQTRRVCKLDFSSVADTLRAEQIKTELCPYGAPGERLWVREAWGTEGRWNGTPPRDIRTTAPLWYGADGRPDGWGGVGRPSIHMPRWASRITLEITDVRAERLMAISVTDAHAEGVEGQPGMWRNYTARAGRFANPVDSYRSLWEQINGEGSWAANPWVWVVEFERLEVAQ